MGAKIKEKNPFLSIFKIGVSGTHEKVSDGQFTRTKRCFEI
jgi:hypothetical protein